MIFEFVTFSCLVYTLRGFEVSTHNLYFPDLEKEVRTNSSTGNISLHFTYSQTHYRNIQDEKEKYLNWFAAIRTNAKKYGQIITQTLCFSQSK